MGILLNPDNIDFQQSLNSEIYVDKTELIKHTNRVLNTEQRFICVSRPRRFGKSMAANMLTAYYSKGCDSRELFSNYKIAKTDSFEKHLNNYNISEIHRTKMREIKSKLNNMTIINTRILQVIVKERIQKIRLSTASNTCYYFDKPVLFSVYQLFQI